MSFEELSLKVLLGRAYAYLLNSGFSVSDFFSAKLQKVRYYLSLRSGFFLPEIAVELHHSLGDNSFVFAVNDYCFFRSDKGLGEFFIENEDFFECDADKIAFLFAVHIISQIPALFTKEQFKSWSDNSFFYKGGVSLADDSLYDRALAALAKSGSINDKNGVLEGDSEQLIEEGVSENVQYLLRALFLQCSGQLSRAVSELLSFSDESDWLSDHFSGESFLYQGKREDALEYFKRCAQNFPAYHEVILLAAVFAFENGDPYLCNQLIACALILYPKSTMLEFLHARLLVETGRKARGVKLMNALCLRSDIYPGALVITANTISDDPDSSHTLLLKALALNSEHYEASCLYVDYLRSVQKYEEALQLIDSMMERDGAAPGLFCRRASIMHELGNSTDAEQDFRRAAIMSSEYISPLLDFYMSEEEYEKAFPLIDEVLREDPFNVSANEYRAFFALKAGDYSSASKCYSKLNFVSPERLDYMLSLSDILFKTGDDKEASKLLMKTRRLFPASEHVLERLGWYYFDRGKIKKAEEIFNEYIESGGNENILILYGKAAILYKRKDYKGASDLCKRCLALSSECDSAWYMLARISLKEGNDRDALKFIKKALALIPDSIIYLEFLNNLTE